ncbi:hypothetical protein PMAYCL1PPCAC_16124, partial [Pristionchus mayeri]
SGDLLYPIIFTPAMICFRVLIEAVMAIPIGYFVGYDKEEIKSQIMAHLHGGFVFDTQRKRILECFSRFFYHSSMFIYDFRVLAIHPCLWDVSACWTGYPFQVVDDDIWFVVRYGMKFY